MSSNSEIYQDNEFIRDNFFVITNENCHEIGNKLYGYVLNDDFLFVNKLGEDRFVKKYDYGYYINITNSSDEIIIRQDYYGLFSLFLYSDDNNFAVSNSLLALINHLRRKGYALTIDKNYMSTILWTWTSLNFKKTIVKEIEHVPNFYWLKINKIKKSIEKIKIDQPKRFINIDSEKGIALIDAWHDRWNNVISSFVSNKLDYKIDITGGKDSRAALTPLYNQDSCDIDGTNLNFYCMEDDQEDIQISNDIAKKLNSKISSQLKSDTQYISLFLCLANSFLSKMTLHNGIDFHWSWNDRPLFSWGGSGGESLREHWHIPPEDLIFTILPFSPYLKKKPEALIEVMEMSANSFSNILYEYKPSNGMTMALYECTRMRCHFGLCGLQYYLTNRFTISPLLDPELSKLNLLSDKNADHNLLFSIINNRFLPSLTEVAFNKNYKFMNKTEEYARYINKKFPYTESSGKKINVSISERKIPFFAKHKPDILIVLKKIFFSKLFAKTITDFFGEDVYYEFSKKIKSDDEYFEDYLFMNTNVSALLSIYLALIAVNPDIIKGNSNELIERLLDIDVAAK